MKVDYDSSNFSKIPGYAFYTNPGDTVTDIAIVQV